MPMFLCGAAKRPVLSFAVHPEVQESDGESFILPVQLKTTGRKTFMGRMPLLTQREVESIYPFPAQDGSMGCAFYLGVHGKALLDAHTVERRGTSVIVLLNGRQVTDLYVNKRVADGLFVVPAGLTQAEIELLQKQFPIKGAPAKR